MAKAISIRNDEQNSDLKSYWIYDNVEQALGRLASKTGRNIETDLPIELPNDRIGSTAYASLNSVVAIGLMAHERLADVIRSSLLYLDTNEGDESFGDQIARIATAMGRARSASSTVFLGRRGRRAAAFLSGMGARHFDLPPIDFSGLPKNKSYAPKLTIINHLPDIDLARAIAHRFLDCTDIFLECFGFQGEDHNRIRYLGDAEVGDGSSNAHLHIGCNSDKVDRLRICDSWQSKIPVLLFDADKDASGSGPNINVVHEHNVLVCNNFAEASAFLSLILNSPVLRRLLTANGRAASGTAAAAWDTIALELAA